MAQRVERCNGEPSRRTDAVLDHLREHERREIRDVLREFTQRGQSQGELGEPRGQLGIEFMLFHQGAHIQRGERHQSNLMLLGPRQQELGVALLGAPQSRQIGDEKDASGGLPEKLRGRFREQLHAREEGRRRRDEEAGEKLRTHAALATQQQRCARLRKLRQALLRVGQRRGAPERRESELRRCRRLGAAQRTLHGREQALQRHRLFQEVERADARGLDRGFDRGVARHHYHWHGELTASGPLLQQGDAIGVGHPDVEQHEVGPGTLAQPARVARAFRQHDLVAFVGKDLR
jgi:hypothetical protein